MGKPENDIYHDVAMIFGNPYSLNLKLYNQ